MLRPTAMIRPLLWKRACDAQLTVRELPDGHRRGTIAIVPNAPVEP